MSEAITQQKQLARTQCRNLRQELTETFRQQASTDICEYIAEWPVFQNAEVILAYMPIKSEADLRILLKNYPEKRWILPRIQMGLPPETSNQMFFHAYDPSQLVRHKFGMDEPAASQAVVAPEEIELALVPGLAYDRDGWRLGYGGGYYDRFLGKFYGVSLGVTFKALLLDHLPHGEYDIAVKWIVTEKGLINSPASAA